MTAEHQADLTPEQERRIEHAVETQGISYALARAAELGERLDSDHKVQDASLPGKPLSFPPSGHVRDFSGDRAVALSPGNMLGSEDSREAYARHRDDLLKQSDARFISNLANQVDAGELTATEAAARLSARKERRAR